MNTKELFDLTGKVAIVTGGGTGIGRQMAEGLAEAGAQVAVCSRRLEVCQITAAEIEKSSGVRALGLETDVTVPESVERMIQATLKEFGRIDILVNSAGAAWAAPAEKAYLEDWRRIMDVNVTGTFVCCQQVGKIMIGQRYGKIVNIASIAGLVGSAPELLDAISYSTSKGAILAMARDLAVKWARYNINVNALVPGYFHTHLTDWIVKNRSEKIIARTPLGRLGGNDDLKGPVVFLSSESSKYITGQIIVVDGGATSGF